MKKLIITVIGATAIMALVDLSHAADSQCEIDKPHTPLSVLISKDK